MLQFLPDMDNAPEIDVRGLRSPRWLCGINRSSPQSLERTQASWPARKGEQLSGPVASVGSGQSSSIDSCSQILDRETQGGQEGRVSSKLSFSDEFEPLDQFSPVGLQPT